MYVNASVPCQTRVNIDGCCCCCWLPLPPNAGSGCASTRKGVEGGRVRKCRYGMRVRHARRCLVQNGEGRASGLGGTMQDRHVNRKAWTTCFAALCPSL